MTPIRLTIAGLLLALSALCVAPVASAQEERAPADRPAVVLQEEGAAQDDAAWTFRYLVPTLLVVTGLALGATIIGYGVRVKGRYRVVR